MIPTGRAFSPEIGEQRRATIDGKVEDRISTGNNHNVHQDNSVLLNVFSFHKTKVMEFMKQSIKQMKHDFQKQFEELNSLK